MDRQSGERSAGGYPAAAGIASSPGANGTMGSGWAGTERATRITTDTGGASRFFPTFYYTAKAPTSERPRVDDISHPTTKPLDLMRWLVRLVTPPGGVVLEPFAGSGTTAEACVVEGFRCIAVEREADYLPLIVARLTKPIGRTLL
jgi:site-specific DNA-methyltransferase (adenine-specific)